MLTFPELKAELDSKFYCQIPIALDRATVQATVHDFLAFLTLPENERLAAACTIKFDDTDKGMDLGYRRRVKGEDGNRNQDTKEFFHYNDYARDRLAGVAATSPFTARFLESAQRIFEPAVEAQKQVLRVLDTNYPGIYDKFFPEDVWPNCALRFLKYDASAPGAFLANGHRDRGAFSLAIAESNPGLRIGHNDQSQLRPVKHTPRMAMFFPGVMLKEHTDGELLGSWHDVVQQSNAEIIPGAARWAIVMFTYLLGPNHTTREDILG